VQLYERYGIWNSISIQKWHFYSTSDKLLLTF